MILGCGYVGSALGLLLAAQGHTAFGLHRNTTALPPAILPVQADLSASLSPDALPPILDAVVSAASPARSTDEACGAAYLDGPCNLLKALALQKSLRRFVFVSGTGVYAQGMGEWVDGESPTEPQSYSSHIHRDDSAGALRHLLLLSDPRNNLTKHSPRRFALSYQQTLQQGPAHLLGLPFPLSHLPRRFRGAPARLDQQH